MAKRITIKIDDDVNKKLRIYQARLMVQHNSFSEVLNEVLRKNLY